MSKKLTKSLAAAAAALLMATQAMAFSASAVQNYYYYYNGIYYSSPYDAMNASGNTSNTYEAVAYGSIPSAATLKYYDSVSKKYYDTKELAVAAGVADPAEIYVGSYYVNTNYSTSGTGYYCSLTGKYYTTYSAALSAAGGQAKYVTYVGSTATSNLYYSSYTGLYYSSYAAALNASKGNSAYVSYMGGDYWYGYNSGYYYSSYTGKYYSTYSAALSASNGNSSYVTYVGSYYSGSNSGYYYSSYTGKYYSTYSAAVSASNGNSSYVTYVGSYYNGSSYGYYYSSYTGKYYSTYAAALSASNGNTSYVTAVGNLYSTSSTIQNGSIYKYYYNGVAYPTLQAAKDAGGTVGVDIYYSPYGKTDDTHYYYYYNGTYYGTIEAAKAAGGTSLGTDITYVPYNYYSDAYINSGYYGYYTYGDPYYTLRNSLTSTTTTTTTTATAEDGEPYIYGNKKKAGWSTIIKYINAASKGDNIKVNMNGATTISKDVLSALDGKNVSVTFVLDNGVKWTVNGKDIDTAKDAVIYTKYNIDYIPDSLVNKAAKDAVSKAEIGISNNYDDFGFEASVTVKFATKRAGCTAVVYCYDSNTESLKGIAKAKVQSDGTCTFSVTAGGPYLIVLK
jgi:hypothetical protein